MMHGGCGSLIVPRDACAACRISLCVSEACTPDARVVSAQPGHTCVPIPRMPLLHISTEQVLISIVMPPPPRKPRVFWLLVRNATGDSAVVCYIRLIQRMGSDGPETVRSNETRVFEKAAGQWVCVHFHKTPV